MKYYKKALTFCFIIHFFLFLPYLWAGTIKIQYDGSIAKDARITSGAVGYNGGNANRGNVTYFSSNNKIDRTYFQIPLPSFITPEFAATITSAKFKVYFDGLQSGPFDISLNEVTSAWDEDLITWLIKPDHNSVPEDTITLEQEYIWVEFEITDLVKNWIWGEKNNYGFVLKPLIEYPPIHDTSSLITSDDSDASFHPVLEITSSDPADTVITGLTNSFRELKTNIISNIQLFPNFPNPFNCNTIINYNLSNPGKVVLKIYNNMGEEIITLINSYQTAGNKFATWNGKNKNGVSVSSGLYYYSLDYNEKKLKRKMLFLK